MNHAIAFAVSLWFIPLAELHVHVYMVSHAGVTHQCTASRSLVMREDRMHARMLWCVICVVFQARKAREVYITGFLGIH